MNLHASTESEGLAGVQVREAALDDVIDLRHRVLREGLPRESAVFAGDQDPGSRHFAAVCDGRVVGCATLHASRWQDEPAWQLRGMATAPDFRGRRIGRAMLAFIE